MVATRCTFEDNGDDGVYVEGFSFPISEQASIELAECVFRKNKARGIYVSSDISLLLRGGSVTGNGKDAVLAHNGAKITVAKAEKDALPQTISGGNGRHDWAISPNNDFEVCKIIGIATEKIRFVEHDG